MNTTSDTARLAAGQFYGAVAERWQTPLVTLSVVRHDRPRQVPLHSHAHMFVTVLLDGEYREWSADGEVVYGPLTAVFHPAGLAHRDAIGRAGTTFFTVEIDPRGLGPHERAHGGLASVRELRGGPVVWELVRLLELVRGRRHDAVDCEEPVMELVDRLIDPPPTAAAPGWLAAVEARLAGGAPVSLAELAALADVCAVHVARVFRRHHGCTIQTYLRRQRVLRACRLIAARRAGLAAIAAESGFYDQSHLNHAFKAVTGMTPRRYRALVASRPPQEICK
jgi:AraC family transcriptional regulator